MAHFAELDSENNVINVLVLADEDCLDGDGNESESVGISFLQSLLGEDTIWKQTSYNNNIRCRYAPIGGYYDSELDAFLYQKPFPSWVFNSETLDWDPPIPMPPEAQERPYMWDEENQQWVEVK